MSCNNISTNAGVKIYIGDQADLPATFSAVNMAAITSYAEISEPANISARGYRRSIIEYTPLSGSVCKQAGITNNGTLSFRVADIPEDAGQIKLQTAAESNLPWPIKIVHADATATLTTPSAEYLTGIVSTYEQADAGSADSIRERMCEIAINNYVFDPRSA
jgi:hypothetical protein